MQAAVHSGRFASVDDAVAEAARLLIRGLDQEQPAPVPPADPILGLMRDDIDLMDEIVEDAYRHRRDGSSREIDI